MAESMEAGDAVAEATVAPDRSDRLDALAEKYGAKLGGAKPYKISGTNGVSRQILLKLADGMVIPGNGINTEAAVADLETKVAQLVDAGIIQEATDAA